MQQALVTPDRIPKWIPGTITMDSFCRDWKGIAMRGYQYDRQDAAIPPMRDYMIVAYDGRPTTMRRTSGGSWQSAPVGKGRVSLLTRAEQSTWCWAEPIQVRHIYIGQDCLEATARTVFGRDPQSVEIDDQVSAEDPILLNGFQMLEDELRNGGIGQRLMIDALRNQIAVHLLRRYARMQFADETGSAFSPAQRRRIIDLIEDQLSENISLGDLAAAVGLSPFHFARQFKADFGIAPYAYVIQKRVSKAQEILRRGRVPLKSVALDCGFSDQSHFCRTFRKVVGTTPAKYQSDV
ncbi:MULTISPECIES: AraC family transcriptional regulator [Rhizobium/Agrobacterium group]|uniref:helix-turn-helix domain-containing protein n=1 Tax=Rhizobium/Agrobacterium group TaxID=227290 RepID=UPI00071607B9|nr:MULTISPECIES: AraC family transcriptional regulator [Rhizobium/Agrobacterium group]KRA64310.1 AraC family transcriptional regulator [Rhizobium sp. Root651]MDH1270859.1 AraC family transcriptional regulator [Agrobacterium pusense]